MQQEYWCLEVPLHHAGSLSPNLNVLLKLFVGINNLYYVGFVHISNSLVISIVSSMHAPNAWKVSCLKQCVE